MLSDLLSLQRRHVNMDIGNIYNRPFHGYLFSATQTGLFIAGKGQALRSGSLPVGYYEEFACVLDPRGAVQSQGRCRTKRHGKRYC
jgi:hypothetical protein